MGVEASVTSIYVAALRSPYQVAKSVGTAAVLSGGRVALGVGVGWCREEFDLLGQDFGTRGARTDEALELMRELWAPGWTSYDGAHYPTPRLVMRPEPTGTGADPGRRAVRRGAAPGRQVRRLGRRRLHDRRGDRVPPAGCGRCARRPDWTVRSR